MKEYIDRLLSLISNIAESFWKITISMLVAINTIAVLALIMIQNEDMVHTSTWTNIYYTIKIFWIIMLLCLVISCSKIRRKHIQK